MRLNTLLFLVPACVLAQGLPLIGIDHVGIQVSNVDTARSFYQGVLGLECDESRENQEGEICKVSESQSIELGRDAAGGIHRVSHVALGTADIDLLRELLRARGLNPTPVMSVRGGRKHFDLYDPDRNRIELVGVAVDSRQARSHPESPVDKRISTHLRHVAIAVRSLEDSVAFYTGRLGFQEVGRTGTNGETGWINLGIPGRNGDFIQLSLISKQLPVDKIGSLEHFCLDIEDGYATYQAVLERGVPPDDHIKPVIGLAKHRKLTISDPDGTHVELMEINVAVPRPGEHVER